ncbi:hypothetical protein BC8716_09205 [Shouchella clausii]|nr:hypothetical protein BC8716_09205 [Shouchella clausii]PAD14712.1 hypothetical protein CHH74_08145 [Shouchella clausii]QNM42471.1 hypothetical protein DUT88_06055 [Shouchella clausii]
MIHFYCLKRIERSLCLQCEEGAFLNKGFIIGVNGKQHKMRNHINLYGVEKIGEPKDDYVSDKGGDKAPPYTIVFYEQHTCFV